MVLVSKVFAVVALGIALVLLLPHLGVNFLSQFILVISGLCEEYLLPQELLPNELVVHL